MNHSCGSLCRCVVYMNKNNINNNLNNRYTNMNLINNENINFLNYLYNINFEERNENKILTQSDNYQTSIKRLRELSKFYEINSIGIFLFKGKLIYKKDILI